MAAHLQELCEDILDNIEDAASCVLEGAFADPGEAASVLQEHLAETLVCIEAALNRLGEEESVDGEELVPALPSSLAEMAETCCDLASELFEAEGKLRDSEDMLRERLAALRYLIGCEPDGFQQQARALA
ncbi:MAG: hypothetical protein ACF8NJ_02815 [Phycisphaerales bacterium JB038]